MSDELDRPLEPRALAARDRRLRCATPLGDWQRLTALDPSGAAPDTVVRVDAGFREDENGVALLEGQVVARLRCHCQRCLEEMELEVCARPKLMFGRADELGAAAVAAGFEHCELEPGMTLRELLEDEVLLAVPAFPVHERSEDCGKLAAKLAELEPGEGGERSSSPFAVLAALKRKN